MLDVKSFSSNLVLDKRFLILIAVFASFLFLVTGWTQFSCYPMITNGVLPKFCNSQSSILEIIGNPKTHGNTLIVLASNPQTDEVVLRSLVASLNSPKVANNPKALQRAIAFNPKTPVDVLDAFIHSEDVSILTSIAMRSNATAELLTQVANNPRSQAIEVQKALVNNPHVPDDVLKNLSKSNEIEVLWQIADLKVTSSDPKKSPRYKASSDVLREVANNPIVNSLEVRDSYSNRLLKDLPARLAMNHNTPQDILAKLATSTNPIVLLKVSSNPNATSSVLEKISENPITWNESGLGIQKALAQQKNLSRKVIEKLAKSNYSEVLADLTSNPAIPLDIKNGVFDRLIQQKDALNSSLPSPQNSVVAEKTKNQGSNCPGKHLRNNFLGGAAAAIGFLFGGPIGALAAFGTVTGSLETVTSISRCQF